MKVRHLLNLKLAGITLLFAMWTCSAWAQEGKIYLAELTRSGETAQVVTKDSFTLADATEELYWFALHEDRAIRYYTEDCRFESNPLQVLLHREVPVPGFDLVKGKGHSILQYVHHHRDSVEKALNILMTYCESVGKLVSNISWDEQVEVCARHSGNTAYMASSGYYHARASTYRIDYQKHSQSRVVEYGDRDHVTLCFKGVSEDDRPALMVLEYLLRQKEHSFQQNMVESGRCLEAEFSYNANNVNDFIGFSFFPNPFAVSESIEVLFDELEKMPLFNYTNKDQLELAKRQIAIDMEFMEDRTLSKNHWLMPEYIDATGDYSRFLDSVKVVTKVDIMDLINRHIHEKPFFLVVNASAKSREQLQGIVRNTQAIERYKLSFTDVKDTKLDAESVAELENVAYVLNLTYWAPVEIHLYGGKKRTNVKREDTVKEYLEKAGVSNPIEVIYHRNSDDLTECITFTITVSEE